LEYEMLSKIVKRLQERFRVHAVILFGSRARGDFKPWSDYDILVIADFKEKYLDRIGVILEALSDVELNIEPHPYTLEEVKDMLRKGSPMMVDALSEGRVLYGDRGF
jgi:predicted nucleotidyltransferase